MADKDIEIALTGNFISQKVKNYIHQHLQGWIHSSDGLLNVADFGNRRKTEQYLQEIENICRFFRNKSFATEPIKLYFFPTPLPKIIDYKKGSLDVEELNSACTFTYPETHFIALYREEEFQKVLFHELIHYDGLDATMPYTADRDFREKYHLTIPTRMPEVYAEIIGMLLNIQYSGGDFNYKYTVEKAFMTLQYQKIMNFFGIKNIENMSLLKSDTNLVTYFVFKLAFLQTIRKPLDYLKNAEKNGLLLKDPKTFLKHIDMGMNKLNRIEKINIPPEFKDTMRMTIVQKD